MSYIVERFGEKIDLSKERKTRCPSCADQGNDKSGNNLHLYGLDENGEHLGCRCFACGFTIPSAKWERENIKKKYDYEKEASMGLEFNSEVLDGIKKEYSVLKTEYRSIRPDIYKFYRVLHKIENGVPVEQIYPTYKNEEIVGFKRRELPKKFLTPYGETGADVNLFGQQLFLTSTSRDVLIVGGEIDAMSAYQMLKDYRDRTNARKDQDFPYVPVVSSTIGESGLFKQAQRQYDWLNRFERIIVCLDSDKAGKEAVEVLVKNIPKNKLYVMELDKNLKDPNEYLKAGNEAEFISAYYKAHPYVPVGVKGSSSLMDDIIQNALIEKIPLPPYMHKLQKMMAGGIPLGVIVNLISSSGTGKCFAEGTKVLMHNMTIKNVEDVEVGDLLMGDDGTPRKVLNLSQGVSDLYEVSQVKGDTYIVNDQHILSLRKSGTDEIVNIGIKDYLNLNIHNKNILKGYKADLTQLDNGEVYDLDDVYMLGLWLADGHSDSARITVNKKDHDLHNEIEKYCIKKCYSRSVSPSSDRVGSICYSLSGGFRTYLNSYNVINNKHIPSNLMTSNYNVRLSLLAGIVDGDGYLDNNSFELLLKNSKFAEDVVLLARSLGLQVTVVDKFSKCQNFEGEIYKRIRINGETSKIPNRLSRKKASKRKQIKNALNTGINVKNIGQGEYYGFEVDGNHLFCLSDLTVTHNSTHVEEIIYHWIFNSPYLCGILSLESDSGEYGTKILSRHVGRKINLIESVQEKLEYLNSDYVQKKQRELFFSPNGMDRFILMDERDGNVDAVKKTVEKMIIECGCKVIVTDPLQDLIACLPDDEQNKFMSWQKGLVKSHKVTFFNVNHTKKALNGGGSGSQGSDLAEEDTHGSSSIYKSGACNLLFSRNKEAEDIVERNTTIMKMSKCRWTGNTSPYAGKYYYDNETHTVHDYEDYWKDRVKPIDPNKDF